MSKITNDGLTRSGSGCFVAVRCTHMATVGVKGLTLRRCGGSYLLSRVERELQLSQMDLSSAGAVDFGGGRTHL